MNVPADQPLSVPAASVPRLTLPALSRGVVDRSDARRGDGGWLAEVWAAPTTRVLPVADGTAPVERDGDVVRLRLRPATELPDVPPEDRWLLGVDVDGTAVFAVPADPGPDAGSLRDVGSLVDDRDAGLFVHAVALDNWHATHRFCPRCGAPTVPERAGHVRRCTADGSEHYPRTDPAVIMIVVDDDGHALLGRHVRWQQAPLFSTLAGFVDPGESLEQAVVREVAEEVGVAVGDVCYLGSQPWPFPSSVMLGFRARAAGSRPTVTCDPTEIAEARWFSPDELVEAVGSGEIQLPSPVSIARRLVESWYGGPLTPPVGLSA